MPEITRDDIQAIAEKYFGDNDAYDLPSQRSFALLVQVASHVLLQYKEEAAETMSLDDPDSFLPPTLGGVPQGWALVEGLRENLEMGFPDDNFDSPIAS